MHLYRVTDPATDQELGVHEAESPTAAIAEAEKHGAAVGEPLATRCRKVHVRIDIELAVEGDVGDALEVVNNLLENGVLQDPLNDHHLDCNEPEVFLRVLSATCRRTPTARKPSMPPAERAPKGHCDG